MGLLDSFEKGLERAVNSAFAKTFRSGIQPVEIASALRSELDKKAAVVSRDRILAPEHVHRAPLAEPTTRRWRPSATPSATSSTPSCRSHAKAQGYSFAGPVSITLERDDQLSTGTLRVDSSTAQGRVAWRGVVDVEGRRHPLVKSRTVIGRGSDADITIADAGTSRKHVEILWDGERAMVRDMNSTNGTTAQRRARSPRRRFRPTRRSRSAAPTSSSGWSRRPRRPSRRCPPTTPPARTTSATAVRLA